MLTPPTCRLSSLGQLSPHVFRSVACVKCLLYIYLAQPPYNSIYQFTEDTVCTDGFLFCNDGGECSCKNPKHLYNLPEFAAGSVQPLHKMNITPPLPHNFEPIVRQCCEAADKCCSNVLKDDRPIKGTCPATWDGWQCFERTTPKIVKKECPAYIFGSLWNRKVEIGVQKQCTPNGKWSSQRPDNIITTQEYTDYRGCHSEETWLRPFLLLTFVAYCISAVATIPAVVLITKHRYLRKQQVFIIHRHLLISLFFSALSYVANALLFMPYFQYGRELFFKNHLLCRFMYIIQFAYLPLTSFAWMLAEGIHLYWLLFKTVAKGSRKLKWLPYFCWGLPALLTVFYAVPAEIYDSGVCLTEPSQNWWITGWLVAPRFVCLGVNVIILCATLKLLIQKLKNNVNCSKLWNYLKVIRAMFVLMPLFGIHLLLVVIEPSEESDVHDIAKMIVNGFQGLIVSAVVCFANRAVIRMAMKKQKRQLDALAEDAGLARPRQGSSPFSSIDRSGRAPLVRSCRSLSKPNVSHSSKSHTLPESVVSVQSSCRSPVLTPVQKPADEVYSDGGTKSMPGIPNNYNYANSVSEESDMGVKLKSNRRNCSVDNTTHRFFGRLSTTNFGIARHDKDKWEMNSSASVEQKLPNATENPVIPKISISDDFSSLTERSCSLPENIIRNKIHQPDSTSVDSGTESNLQSKETSCLLKCLGSRLNHPSKLQDCALQREVNNNTTNRHRLPGRAKSKQGIGDFYRIDSRRRPRNKRESSVMSRLSFRREGSFRFSTVPLRQFKWRFVFFGRPSRKFFVDSDLD